MSQHVTAAPQGGEAPIAVSEATEAPPSALESKGLWIAILVWLTVYLGLSLTIWLDLVIGLFHH
jgi:hypothetical protein